MIAHILVKCNNNNNNNTLKANPDDNKLKANPTLCKHTTITSPSAYMVRLYVNVQFKVKPLSTGTSSSRTKKF